MDERDDEIRVKVELISRNEWNRLYGLWRLYYHPSALYPPTASSP